MKILFIIASCFLLTGCATIAGWRDSLVLKAGFQKQSKVQQQINQLKIEKDKAIEEATKKVSDDKDNVIKDKDNQILKAGSALYAADKTYSSIINPNRTDILTNDFVNEAWAALGHPMPDYYTLLDINARLKKDLDEKQTSLNQLKQEHDKVIQDNQKLVDQTNNDKKQLDQNKKDLEDTKTSYNNKIDDKQIQLDKINKDIQDKQGQLLANAESMKAFKEKASLIVGGLALACLLSTIYSPVFKLQLGIASATFTIVTYLIWIIQPWMIMIGVGIIILGLVGHAVYEHNKETVSATSTYRALQQIKTTSSDVWGKDIAPVLKEWQSKYIKSSDGTITTIPDPTISAHIDQTLMKVGDK